MSKPLPSQNTFAALSPPWSLVSLDANFTNVWAAIDDVGTYSNVFVDTGAVNAMVVAVTAPLTFSLVDGVTLDVKVGNTTTSNAPTLNVAGTGAKTIVNADNTILAIGQLPANMRVRFVYDLANTVWRITSITAGVSSFVIGPPASGVPLTVNTLAGSYGIVVNVAAASVKGIEVTAAAGGVAEIDLLSPAGQAAAVRLVGNGNSIGTNDCFVEQLSDNSFAAGTNANANLTLTTNGVIAWKITGSQAIQGLGPVAAAFVDMTPDKSQWTTTLSGPWIAGNNVTGTLKWERQGTQVTVWCDATIDQAATISASIAASGLPAAITPSSNREVVVSLVENNTASAVGLALIQTTNVINFFVAGVSGSILQGANFTGAGRAGILANCSFTYSV